jgi:hypothetical protein
MIKKQLMIGLARAKFIIGPTKRSFNHDPKNKKSSNRVENEAARIWARLPWSIIASSSTCLVVLKTMWLN